MPDIVGIVFQNGGKVYYFDPAELELARGEQVVVQTMRGTEIGEVVDGPREVPDEDLPAPLKRVVRKANIKDLETLENNRALRAEAMRACRELIEKHGLDMKLVDAEIVFGGGKVTFSFSAEERVDFRQLVSDLAKVLKMRIELRQIGAREEARLVGGLGPCGRDLCCSLWQGDQDPVSIRMAKEQNLPLNPMKISGLCGRLMCCLKYEQEQYVCFRKEVPNRGTKVQTEFGEGVVVGFQVTKESLTLRMEDGTIADVPLNRCQCGGAPCGGRAEAGASDEGAAISAADGPRGNGSSRSGGRGGAPSEAGLETATDTDESTAVDSSIEGSPQPAAPEGSPIGQAAPAAGVQDAAGTSPETDGTGPGPAAGSPATEGGDKPAGRGRSGRSRRRRRRPRKPSGGAGGGQQGS
jgi:cell fate regulator YaaT (PSP1 superfamily)